VIDKIIAFNKLICLGNTVGSLKIIFLNTAEIDKLINSTLEIINLLINNLGRYAMGGNSSKKRLVKFGRQFKYHRTNNVQYWILYIFGVSNNFQKTFDGEICFFCDFVLQRYKIV